MGFDVGAVLDGSCDVGVDGVDGIEQAGDVCVDLRLLHDECRSWQFFVVLAVVCGEKGLAHVFFERVTLGGCDSGHDGVTRSDSMREGGGECVCVMGASSWWPGGYCRYLLSYKLGMPWVCPGYGWVKLGCQTGKGGRVNRRASRRRASGQRASRRRASHCTRRARKNPKPETKKIKIKNQKPKTTHTRDRLLLPLLSEIKKKPNAQNPKPNAHPHITNASRKSGILEHQLEAIWKPFGSHLGKHPCGKN